jgi:ribosomal protein L22
MSDRILAFWENEIEPTHSAIETLRFMGMEYFRRMIQHPNELKVQFLAISGIEEEDIFNQLRNDHKKYIKYISAVIQRGIDQGEIRKDADVEALAVTYNGFGIALNMMRLLALKGKYSEETVSTILDHFLDSIKS